MRVFIYLFVSLLLVSCVSSGKYAEATAMAERLRADSISLENRIRKLVEEKEYLENKSAQTEQALNQRLQEKEDSLNAKEKLLRDREYSLSDMQSRKEQEEEAFRKLAKGIQSAFHDFNSNELRYKTQCAKVVIEISDKLLFVPHSTKAEPKASLVFARIKEVMNKNTDLQLIIVTHTDSINNTKEKVSSLLELGSTKARILTENLIKETGISPARITCASQGAAAVITKQGNSIGNERTELIFYSNLIPCIYTKE